MICSKCGKQLFENEIICSNCGYNNSSNLNNNIVENNIESSNISTNISNNELQFNFNTVPIQNNINNEVLESINYNDNIDNPNVDTNIKSNSHNNIKKKNNILLIILPLVGILLVGLIVFLIFGSSEEKEIKELRENTYTMYIKINPLVKLMVKEEYYECTNKTADSAEICSEIKSQVISYNLINQDAKDIYTDIDLTGKDVVEALVILYDTAVDNDASLGVLEVTTDWNNRYSQDELTKVIKEKSKHDGDLQLTIDIKDDIKINEILEKYQIEEKIEITYTITFNSDGGSKVSEQSVKENEKVEKPTNPTRDGYKFIAWQLNGKNYDFNNEVTSDLELKAKWEKIENTNSKNESQDKNNNTNDNKEDNKQETKPETKVESTLNKINLNDNIKVYEDIIGTFCGAYVFSTNVETVFAGYIQNRMIENDIAGYDEKYNQLL